MFYYKYMANKIDISNLISITEAAKILGITRATIYAWLANGQLHSVKIGGNTYLNRIEVLVVNQERTQ